MRTRFGDVRQACLPVPMRTRDEALSAESLCVSLLVFQASISPAGFIMPAAHFRDDVPELAELGRDHLGTLIKVPRLAASVKPMLESY